MEREKERERVREGGGKGWREGGGRVNEERETEFECWNVLQLTLKLKVSLCLVV